MTNAYNPATNRQAYQGQTLLSANVSTSADTWTSSLNNNVLVLGCSGGGKTRHHLKPNLMQCQGSYIVLDSKGTLYKEMAPFLRLNGYGVAQLDFTTMEGTIGYNPLDFVRFANSEYSAQDVMAIASTICPASDSSEPFWELAAANYLASYIHYVLEALPTHERTFASVISVYEKCCEGYGDELFRALKKENPDSYAARLYNRAKVTTGADRMHSSVMGILAANLYPLGFPSAMKSYEADFRIDFTDYASSKRALFVRLDDMDRSMDRLTSLFVQQAFTCLCDFADNKCEDGRLPIPVRFMLDDFANLRINDFDNVLSVIRSREISATVICQTVSQLDANYGTHKANSIIGNCDQQLILGFQDAQTANYFSLRANKPASALLETEPGKWWVFLRGHKGQLDTSYQLESHPAYQELLYSQNIVTVEGDEDWYEDALAFWGNYGPLTA